MADDVTKPLIDDQFWFDKSLEMVNGSIERLDKAADSIKTFIVWAFGIYTGSMIFTVEYKKIEEWWLLLLLLLPYLTLILVYWQSIGAQQPISAMFDGRAPAQIREAYTSIYKQKVKELSWLRGTSFVAVLSLVFALGTAFCIRNAQIEAVKTDVSFNGVWQEGHLLITGNFPADSVLLISRTVLKADSIVHESVLADTVYKVLNSPDGSLHLDMVADSSAASVKVGIQWNDAAVVRRLERRFDVPAALQGSF